jgi:phosphopantothenoylcysteine decarboxylase / phosphopantothenate---cysteine ligase
MPDTSPTLDILSGRRVIIGVTGGIAAYKVAGLVSRLRSRGADVRVVMTEAGTWFVTPTTFAALSGHEVATALFGDERGDELAHIRLQEFGEAFLIAPASANILGKAAHGIADDLLSTAIMAAKCPVVFAPAMNDTMWCNPIVQGNVAVLKRHGYRFVMPETGRLACGTEGTGRLAAEEFLLAGIEEALLPPELGPDLTGRRLVISAGPTREPLDPVRFLSNRSTGKMGYALARAAERMGAEVALVSGPTDLGDPPGVRTSRVTTCAEMKQAVLQAVGGADAFISAAAPADYRPTEYSPAKLKKGGDLALPLARTDDILLAVAQAARPPVLVGFAAETGEAVARGREKLTGKGLDLLVVNDVTEAGSGFAVDTNRVVILRADGTERDLPLMSKLAVARVILADVAALLNLSKEQ